MYEYRQLCEVEQLELVFRRLQMGRPAHAPPRSRGVGLYHLTGACYEHACFVEPASRRHELANKLLELIETTPGSLHAWVVLPNHYHLVWGGDLDVLGPKLGRLHNGTSTQWNREDADEGRQVWHSFGDRRMRSQGHFYASINYVHGNPVKHGWVNKAEEWEHSSVHEWVKRKGREYLIELWKRYPPRDYGRGWDD